MFTTLSTPNIPNSKVTCAIVGNYEKLKTALNNLEIRTLTLSTSLKLSVSVSNHADMLCCHLGKKNVLLERTQISTFNELCTMNFSPQFLDQNVGVKYPNDVPLNAVFCGEYFIANLKTVSKKIIDSAIAKRCHIIDVNQGYSKCSVCVVNDNSIITDDESIAKACETNGMNVLPIQKGSIKLNGHNYGFIGGCTGLIDKNLLAFCGDIDTHSDSEKIKAFLKSKSIKYISLFPGELMDVGGILPVLQTNDIPTPSK